VNLLLAYYSRPIARSGQGGGVSIHIDSLVVVCLCIAFLVREYRRHTAPKRAERQKKRDDCAAFGHQWSDEYPAMGEYVRDCRNCGKQQHTISGRWPTGG
jgi:hypothetical protein